MTDLAVALSGTDASSFTLDTTALDNTLASLGTTTFSITPDTGLTADTYTAIVTISDTNLATDYTFDISFTVDAATYSIDVTDPVLVSGVYTFTSELEGYSSITPTEFVIENTGTGAMTDMDVVLSGTDAANFDLDKTGLTAALAASGTTSFFINPVDSLPADTYTATVTISDTNLATDYTFDISFTVDAATYSIDVTDPVLVSGVYTFTDELEGYGSITPTEFVVENTGTGAMTDMDVALSGTDAANFTLDKIGFTSTLAVSSTTSFFLNPVDSLPADTYTATVTISDTNLATEYTFDISFTVGTYSIAVTDPVIADGGLYIFMSKVEGYADLAVTSFEITNADMGAMTNLAVALGGADATSFTLDDSGVDNALVSSGTTMFTIKPNHGLTGGTYTAKVTISDTNLTTDYTFDLSFTVFTPSSSGGGGFGQAAIVNGTTPTQPREMPDDDGDDVTEDDTTEDDTTEDDTTEDDTSQGDGSQGNGSQGGSQANNSTGISTTAIVAMVVAIVLAGSAAAFMLIVKFKP